MPEATIQQWGVFRRGWPRAIYGTEKEARDNAAPLDNIKYRWLTPWFEES